MNTTLAFRRAAREAANVHPRCRVQVVPGNSAPVRVTEWVLDPNAPPLSASLPPSRVKYIKVGAGWKPTASQS